MIISFFEVQGTAYDLRFDACQPVGREIEPRACHGVDTRDSRCVFFLNKRLKTIDQIFSSEFFRIWYRNSRALNSWALTVPIGRSSSVAISS